MFVGKARSPPYNGAPERCFTWVHLGKLWAYPENIRLEWKGLSATNTLAYYKNMYITAVKGFIELAPGVNLKIL
jgi:hypothetical protein